MELLASINRPTCNGRSVCAAKFIICRGGSLLSRILNWSCFRSRTNLPSLSTTVKTTLTSSVRTRTVGICGLLESLLALSCCCWPVDGDGVGAGVGCCAIATLQTIEIGMKRDRYFLRVIKCGLIYL